MKKDSLEELKREIESLNENIPIPSQLNYRAAEGLLKMDTKQELKQISQGMDYLQSLAKVKEKTDQLKYLLTELDDLHTEFEFHNEEITSLIKKWIQSQAELEEKKYECGHLATTLKIQQKQLERRDCEIEQLNSKLRQQQQALDTQQELLLKKEAERDLISVTLQENSSPTILKKDNQKEQDDVETAKKELRKNQLRLQEKIKEVAQLQQELLETKEDMEPEQQNSAQQDEELLLLQQQLDQLNEEIERENQTMYVFKEELETIKNNLASNPLHPKCDNDEGETAPSYLKNSEERKSKIQQDYQEKYSQLKEEFEEMSEEYQEFKRAVEKLIEPIV